MGSLVEPVGLVPQPDQTQAFWENGVLATELPREITQCSKSFESIYSMPAYTDQSWEKMFTAEICPCQEIEIHKCLHLENRHIIYILAGMCYFAKGFPKGCFPIVSSQHFQVNKFSRE